jgi:hypothetical protein
MRSMVTSNSSAARFRGRELAQRIAITRSHLLGTPRFMDLPWPPGYDLNMLAARQLRDIASPRNARVIEQLVPMVIESAIAAWEQDGDIKSVREGKLSLEELKAKLEALARNRRRYPSPF